MTEVIPAPVETAPHVTVLVGLRGFPLAATKREDKEGENFDQYDTADEHAENFVVPDWFPVKAWRGKVIYDGFCSTYREWHITWRGFFAGLRCGTFEDLPKCPVLWQDEAQYYEAAAAVAYDLKRGSQSAILTGVGLVLTYFGVIKGGSA